MMLVSVTLLPPSCLAMLPQKFSAATTMILPPGLPAPACEPEAAVEHPAASAAVATAARTAVSLVPIFLTQSPDRAAARNDTDHRFR